MSRTRYWHVLQKWTERDGWIDAQVCESLQECQEARWELENLRGYQCRIVQRRRKQ